jgi:predicted component of type VI protein secretion system
VGLVEHFYQRKRPDAKVQGIVEHLNHMLNTRKGFGSWLKDYGIGDYTVHKARNKALEKLIEEIQETVRIYDPRVSIDSIEEVESGSSFRVKLEVRCSFLEFEKPVSIVIDSLQNKVSVEGF